MSSEIEIERKFLVKDKSFISFEFAKHEIHQYYLSIDGSNTVRVRDKNGQYTYTTKNDIGIKGGMEEIEKTISQDEFEFHKSRAISYIHKHRYMIKAKEQGLIWEIDVYDDGLIVAEIELPDINKEITIPDFIGKEVTGDRSYSNASLSKPIR